MPEQSRQLLLRRTESHLDTLFQTVETPIKTDRLFTSSQIKEKKDYTEVLAVLIYLATDPSPLRS
jgi:hypothetical protein